jgi:hypothetical protein
VAACASLPPRQRVSWRALRFALQGSANTMSDLLCWLPAEAAAEPAEWADGKRAESECPSAGCSMLAAAPWEVDADGIVACALLDAPADERVLALPGADPAAASAAAAETHAPTQLPAPATAAAPPAWLIGRRVVRFFGGVPYGGAVVSTRADSSGGQLWHVEFDDGDEEDVNWRELRGALQAAAAASDGEEPPPPPAAVAPPLQRAHHLYKGVTRHVKNGRGRYMVYATVTPGGGCTYFGTFSSELEAAHAYDATMRAHGLLCVNFPQRPGEVQAVPKMTLAQRDAAAASAFAVRPTRAAVAAEGAAPLAAAGAHATPGDGACGASCGAAAATEARKRERPGAPHEPLMSTPAPKVARRPAPHHTSSPAGGSAPAAPAAVPAEDAIHLDDDEDDASGATLRQLAPVASFLTAVSPPLSCLSASLAALPGSGVSMAHLESLAALPLSAPMLSAADRRMLFDDAAAALAITRPLDRLAFVSAVLRLAPSGAAAGAC